MDKKLTKEDIIKVAKCCIVDSCGSCPLIESGKCITDFMKHILEYMKTEPAPAATGTSSEVSVKEDTDNIHLNDSTLLNICQEELEKISEIALGDFPNEYLTGYIVAFKKNIKRLRGEQSD